MKRRSFLIGTSAGVFAVSRSLRILAANAPCISRLRGEQLPTIGDPAPGGGLSSQGHNVESAR